MMLSDEEAYAIKEMEKLSKEELINQIKEISLSAWGNQLETITLRAWLTNFTGEVFGNVVAEQNLALWLVLNFVFYTDADIRSLSVNLWWKYIHQIMEEYENSGFMEGKPLEEKYKYIIDNTVIQPLGNCSGSGTNVCYFFRQSNGLKKELFGLKNDEDYKYLVLLDDATVSGHQAKEYLEQYANVTTKDKFILTYISTVKAREYIGDEACVISSIEMDNKSKCFDEDSYVFSRHKNWISAAKKMCKHYGKIIDPRNPYGFRTGQYLFGFYYNIPNNTLPIFWGSVNGWIPLFNRYFSDCDKWEEINGEKFY